MVKLRVHKWTFCVCFFVLVCSCTSDNRMQFAQDIKQCQKEANCLKKTKQNCVELPYYNDKSETIELLTYILHGENNATLSSGQSDRMQIIYKAASVWGTEYSLQVIFDDNAHLMKICPENASDWFRSKKHFVLALQQKYLNVAKIG